MATRYDVELAEIAELLDGEPAFRARQVFEGLHQGLRTPEEMTNLPLELRKRVAELLPPSLEVAAESHSDDGQTTKWALRLSDGAQIETVLMAYDEHSEPGEPGPIASQPWFADSVARAVRGLRAKSFS